MFAAWCDHEATEVLLSERRITDIRVEADTVTVRFVCWCGAEGAFADPRLTARSAAHLSGATDHVLGRRQLA
jgi:hypothetical protein